MNYALFFKFIFILILILKRLLIYVLSLKHLLLFYLTLSRGSVCTHVFSGSRTLHPIPIIEVVVDVMETIDLPVERMEPSLFEGITGDP
jgi:hypothetical protein